MLGGVTVIGVGLLWPALLTEISPVIVGRLTLVLKGFKVVVVDPVE